MDAGSSWREWTNGFRIKFGAHRAARQPRPPRTGSITCSRRPTHCSIGGNQSIGAPAFGCSAFSCEAAADPEGHAVDEWTGDDAPGDVEW